jgi:fructose-specific component phosphotransferase system IIB-like protein
VLIRHLAWVLVLAPSAPSAAWAEPDCTEQLEVVSATARYATRMFQGKPTRRDVTVRVDVRSTATVAITAAELGVFLGASLEDIENTRPEALPTRSARTLAGGGRAFRTEVQSLVPPESKRTLEVVRKAIPLDEDLYGVKVVLVSCKRAYAVQEVTIAMPADAGPPLWLIVAALLVVGATVVLLMLRLR